MLNIDKLMLGHDKLIAQITHIAGARKILIKIQSIAYKFLPSTVQMMYKFYNELVGDQFADLLPGEKESTEFAHGLISLLFILDRYLLTSADVPYTV